MEVKGLSRELPFNFQLYVKLRKILCSLMQIKKKLLNAFTFGSISIILSSCGSGANVKWPAYTNYVVDQTCRLTNPNFSAQGIAFSSVPLMLMDSTNPYYDLAAASELLLMSCHRYSNCSSIVGFLGIAFHSFCTTSHIASRRDSVGTGNSGSAGNLTVERSPSSIIKPLLSEQRAIASAFTSSDHIVYPLISTAIKLLIHLMSLLLLSLI